MGLYSNLNTHRLLMEAAETELTAVDSIFEDEIESTFEDIWAGLPELSEPINYTVEAVNVFGIGENDTRAIVVEYDELAKYMMSNNITNIIEALENISTHYNIDDLGIVIESYDDAVIVIEEAKKAKSAGNKNALKQVKASTDFISKLKEKGIKVWKKKGLKKGKKKK